MPLYRIVKMTFDVDKVDSFLKLFATVEDKIRSFQGCLSMEAFRDTKDPAVIFTFSVWENLENLEKYRNSELFRSTWAETKRCFAAPAEAWSLENICAR